MKTLLMMLVAVVTLNACAIRYDKGQGVYGAVACVNVTGPGFSWLCPDKLQVPAIPQVPQPSVPQ